MPSWGTILNLFRRLAAAILFIYAAIYSHGVMDEIDLGTKLLLIFIIAVWISLDADISELRKKWKE